jgi:hypothetical protein
MWSGVGEDRQEGYTERSETDYRVDAAVTGPEGGGVYDLV